MGGTASLDLFFDESSTNHLALCTNVGTAAAAQATVLTLTSGTTVTGTAYVTGYDITATAGQVVRASINLQFTGAITVA
jgi:hypothetical protein